MEIADIGQILETLGTDHGFLHEEAVVCPYSSADRVVKRYLNAFDLFFKKMNETRINSALCFSDGSHMGMDMNINLVTALIGITTGALGYWLSTFHIQPILRFNDVRNQVLMDFIYYAQVINAISLNDEMRKLYRERVLTNRKTSAQLFAATQCLPSWYRCYLRLKNWAPEEAAKHLISFSNTTEYEQG